MASKRRRVSLEPSQQGAKRLKKDENSNSTTVLEPTEVAGLVEKIVVKDFMCHACLEVDFNRHINFIVGRNGSGKSAVLTALVVGLGGKASSTNRGSSLKDFIKKGRNSATIQITLSNVGTNHFKPDIYGDKIVIVRILSSGSGPSGYRLKNAKGDLISNRREELDKMIGQFNIQVENPISILNQDVARTFLNTSDPSEKYRVFMRAIRMDQVNRLYQETITTEVQTRFVFSNRKEALLISKNEVEELQRKWNSLQSISSHREKSKRLEQELYWAVAVREETVLASWEKQLQEQIELTPEKLAAVENCEERLQTLEAKSSDLITQEEQLQQTLLELNSKLNKEKIEEKQNKDQCRNKLKEHKELRKKVAQINSDISMLREEISKSGPDFAVKRQKIQSEIDSYTEEEEQLKAIRKTKENDCLQLRGDLEASRGQYQSLQSEASELSRSIDELQKRIRLLKSQSSNKLTVYGASMPGLLQRINTAYKDGKFKQMPRGPIGAYISLKDAAWAVAVEGQLSSILRNFCVDNAADAKVLLNIFKSELRSERQPGITISKFIPKVHDVRRNLVVAEGYSSLLDMLIISDPIVTNSLIDQREVEGILLIPTSDEAYDMMGDARKVPRNCKKAVTMKGDLFFPHPDYRSYAGQGNSRAQFLQVSTKDVIANLEEEVVMIQRQLAVLNEKLNRENEKIRRTQLELKEVETTRQNLWKKLSEITSKITNLRDSQDQEPSSHKTLVAELKFCENKCDELKNQLSALDTETDGLNQMRESITKRIEKLEAEIRRCEAMDNPIKEELFNIKREVKEINLKLKGLRNAYEMHGEKIKHIEIDANKQREKTTKAVTDATTICPKRINTKRFPHVVQKELEDNKHYVKSVEGMYGSYHEVGNAYAEKNDKYKELMAKMEKFGVALQMLQHSLQRRKDLYTIIQKLMGIRVIYMFQPILKQRQYRGSMEICHLKKTLVIQASPIRGNKETTKDTKSLSGGERSYSTIAFILALWETVEPPFYFLDEFDVFMDKMNRRVIMELLLAHARQKKRYQFVFLTPQDTSSIQSSTDITIHRMEDPERGNKSIVKV